nr:Wadjet anti-phage system protein JetD domain-containing protein [Acanthopleuribacter pedis]
MDVFGSKALRRNGKGQLILSYTKLFEGQPADFWVPLIHQLLKRPVTTASGAAVARRDAMQQCLGSFRIQYPKSAPIHAWLAANRGLYAKRLATEGQAALIDEWQTALAIHDFLLEADEPIALADLSTRFTGHSKRLREGAILETVAIWLALSLGEPPPQTADARRRLLEEQGLLFHLTSIRVTLAGPLVYQLDGFRHDWIARHAASGLSATLPLDVVEAVARFEIVEPGVRVITCENETPFYQLTQTHRDLCIYTEGFPNRAVKLLLEKLSPRPERVHHWGDSDLAGLRIAAQLARTTPVALWRCDLATLKRLTNHARPMTDQEKKRALRFLERTPDFEFPEELRFSLDHGWLEQEAWLFNG